MPNTSVALPLSDEELRASLRAAALYDALDEIVQPILNTVVRKNADYGSAFREDGVIGVSVRLKDKLNRLITLSDGRPALVVQEKIEDTVRDMIGYGLLMLLLMEEQGNHVATNLAEDFRVGGSAGAGDSMVTD